MPRSFRPYRGIDEGGSDRPALATGLREVLSVILDCMDVHSGSPVRACVVRAHSQLRMAHSLFSSHIWRDAQAVCDGLDKQIALARLQQTCRFSLSRSACTLQYRSSSMSTPIIRRLCDGSPSPPRNGLWRYTLVSQVRPDST